MTACPKCGGRAVEAKSFSQREPTGLWVCDACGCFVGRCRCRGTKRLEGFGLTVESDRKEDVARPAHGAATR
jgi:hypothetical protein